MSNIFSLIKTKAVCFGEQWMQGHLDKACVIYLNPSTYLYFRKNINLINNIDYVRFDGLFMSSILKIFGIKIRGRESFDMTSLAPIVFERCIEKNYSIFLLGGAPGDCDKFIENISELYSGLNIVGTQHGYFSDEDFVINKISKSNADLVLVGLGGKKQEAFANKLRLHVDGMIFTCGAFLSQTALRVNYYPGFVDKLNLRGVYRILNDRGVLVRVLKTYPIFAVIIFYDFLSFRFGRMV